ncbi:MAG: hypothetical protein BJ554DRAFT_8461 [Olpidium bornovanus]|uniref:Uncharacterized protein n=1 Tax=Olpidium bornovanus TaxID=278681 RepID=A0A8H7ZUN4_9FUNG|nr:MAG: hypothetical protein BJ554DRAFT_8461 [Olpidium bornovanus]
MAACLSHTKQMMTRRVEPGLLAAKQVGNMYCASVCGSERRFPWSCTCS